MMYLTKSKLEKACQQECMRRTPPNMKIIVTQRDKFRGSYCFLLFPLCLILTLAHRCCHSRWERIFPSQLNICENTETDIQIFVPYQVDNGDQLWHSLIPNSRKGKIHPEVMKLSWYDPTNFNNYYAFGSSTTGSISDFQDSFEFIM